MAHRILALFGAPVGVTNREDGPGVRFLSVLVQSRADALTPIGSRRCLLAYSAARMERIRSVPEARSLIQIAFER